MYNLLYGSSSFAPLHPISLLNTIGCFPKKKIQNLDETGFMNEKHKSYKMNKNDVFDVYYTI